MNIDLDIIIPCYNAKETLFYTLSSISVQKNVFGYNVYLVNDKSDYNYDEEVNYFSKFYNIKEIKLDKNMGPGIARREGIINSNSKYIMFIDSDDILYDCHSIFNLYSNVLCNDLCISSFILERDNVKTIKKYDKIWLHGKMYSREFLKKYNINFNDTRANEDNGFNRLILLLQPRISYIDNITYVYRENSNSITRSNNREYKISGLEGFVDNMIWAMNEAQKRGCNTDEFSSVALGVLISMYYDYLLYINEENARDILKYSKKILPYYKKENIKESDILKTMIYKESALKNENKDYNKSITYEQFLEQVMNYD